MRWPGHICSSSPRRRSLSGTVDAAVASVNLSPPTFSSADAELVERYPVRRPWGEVAAEDQGRFRALRNRLKALATEVAEAGRTNVALVPHVSMLNPNGRSPSDMWCCVFPEVVPNKSFGLQVAMIVNAAGAELCVCLGSGEAQERDPDRIEANHEALALTQTRLAETPRAVRDELAEGLGDRWQYRRKWRQQPGASDFTSLDEWLEFASSPGGAGASISRNLTRQEPEERGPAVQGDLSDLVDLAQPLIDWVYQEAPRGPWAGAIEICRRLLSDREQFDRQERDYKLEIIERLQAVFAASLNNEPVAELLKVALRPPNNLLNWRVQSRLMEWASSDEEVVRHALKRLADDKSSLEDRIDDFISAVPSEALSTPGARLSTASLLLMGLDHQNLFLYRPTVFDTVERILGWSPVDRSDSFGGQYRHHRGFAEHFAGKLRDHGVEPRDMLDVQSLLYVLATSDEPAIRRWRGETGPSDDLSTLIETWRKEEGYPTERDAAAEQALADLAPALSEPALENPDWASIRAIIADRTRGKLGQAGTAPLSFIDHAGPEERAKLAREVRELIYGDAPLADRLDAFGASGLKGIKGAVAFKLLSFAHPERILPIFSYWSDAGKGKEDMLRLKALGLSPPSTGSFGELSVAANDALRERLAPYFGEDTWAMTRFLYWLRWHHPPEEDAPPSSLQSLADELNVDAAFLEKTVALLERKRQIIFYGPPGTGKTFIARKLARYLTEADPTRFEIVQFHPSYSYEDFVQGYRPRTSDEGSVSYKLKNGPLLRLAEDARKDLDRTYVLLIDEINRGNLPRILGELLYLLEYRKDAVTLMYAEEDDQPFSLPENLLFIGTMNTADRSIGLIDAALRRRFSFVPLFPGRYPLTNTLRAWLAANVPDMAFVANLVDRLNERLVDRFGEQLQVGYSYFMDEDLDEEVLKTIWEADILPFLEDQLLGQEEDGLRDFKLPALRSPKPLPPAAIESGDEGMSEAASAD